jgi:sentrin-specific protease 7
VFYSSHFENTFTKVQSEIRKLQKREPEDIRIAKKNNEATVGAKLDKAQAAKERTPRLIDQLDKDEDPAPGNQKLVQGRNPRSSIDALSIELEELSRPTKTARLDDSNPHATRSRNATREFGPRELAKLRSASPERWTELHPDWAHNWESSIIYPNEGKHKATVDKQDIERLDEGKFLNDNLIMFYLLKLERDLAQRDPAMSKRVYFHNTFFYEALTTPVKGKRGINYEAVKRWTSRVNLLSYDYIIVPVNENSHWYLAIIYNAPKLVNPDPQVNEIPQSQETNTDARQSQSNTGSTKKVPPASPQNPSRISPSETSVGEHMRNMSLEEEEKERLDPSPMNALTVQTAPKQRNNLVDLSRSDPQPIRDRIAHEEAMTAATETSKQVAPTKRGKRKSLTPAPRKFSPKEPKIITLDSLGMAHSATCTNLRDYLIAEGKSKLDVEISAPRALGMTAVNIPQQKNCCDCGLFLLSYVKEFLGDPDEFTASLLEKLDMDVEHRFTTAPDLRNDIRELLFNLQMEQVAAKTEKNLAKQKGGKAKKPLKAHGGTSTPVESVSREQPKSAGPSTDADRPKSRRSSAQPELRERETAPEPSDRAQGMEHHTQKPASRTADLGGQERDTKGYDPETEPKLDITSKLATRNYINLNEGVDDSIHMPNSNERPSGLIGTIQGTLKNNKNSKSSELTQSGASRDTAFEVQDDSPHKCGHATHRVSDPDTRLQSDPEFPYPDSEQQLNPRRGRESTPYPETLRSVSPDVDETSIEDRNQRTPSPKDSQNPNSSPLEPAAKLPSPDSASDIVDMTGDESQTADDQEMLLSQHAVSVPPLLDNSSAPNTPIQPPKKQRTVASPQRSSSRKSSDPKAAQSPQSVSTRQRPEEFMAGRDSSDQHIVGKWKVGERKGIRTNFTL